MLILFSNTSVRIVLTLHLLQAHGHELGTMLPRQVSRIMAKVWWQQKASFGLTPDKPGSG
jgi:hypothetical protein